jgi:hypothetical protein
LRVMRRAIGSCPSGSSRSRPKSKISAAKSRYSFTIGQAG